MADQKFIKEVKDADTGVTYEFELGDMYLNFGGRVQLTLIKNKGKAAEKRLPATNVQVQSNLSGNPITEEFAEMLKTNPLVKQFIEEILKEAAKPYQEA